MRLAIMRAAVSALILTAAGARAQAQDGVFLPNVHLFRTPIADPMATRISVGLLSTNLLASQGDERPPFAVPDPEQSARETVAAVAVGAIFPLLKLAAWEAGGAALIADFKVFSRFRIQLPSRDDMGQDWYVGGGVDWKDDLWSGRVAIMHRSSHIGDEFALATGARRIEFGSEQLDVTTAYDVPGIARVYGGGSWIFRSYLGWEPLLENLDLSDRAAVQLGIDREWTPSRDPRLRVYTGVDWHAAERTSWRGGVAAAAGIGVATPRSLRLMARFYDGHSTMGEFFRTPERYFTVELVGEF
jgi:Protein of unknown function (DUF1207)